MPVKAVPPPNDESLVVDHLVVRLDLRSPSILTFTKDLSLVENPNPPPSAAALIGAGIRDIIDAPEDTTVTVRERDLQIIKPDPDNPGRGTHTKSIKE